MVHCTAKSSLVPRSGPRPGDPRPKPPCGYAGIREEGLVTFECFLGDAHHYVIVFQMVLRNPHGVRATIDCRGATCTGIAYVARIQARIWLKTGMLSQHNQENSQLSPDPFPCERVESGDETRTCSLVPTPSFSMCGIGGPGTYMVHGTWYVVHYYMYTCTLNHPPLFRKVHICE